jgi:hypothetical protein
MNTRKIGYDFAVVRKLGEKYIIILDSNTVKFHNLCDKCHVNISDMYKLSEKKK